MYHPVQCRAQASIKMREDLRQSAQWRQQQRVMRLRRQRRSRSARRWLQSGAARLLQGISRAKIRGRMIKPRRVEHVAHTR